MDIWFSTEKNHWNQECCHGNNIGVILFLSGAKFKGHCSNICGDIIDSVF